MEGFALGRYKFKENEGIYTDMNAIRRMNTWTKFIQSMDQWD